MSSVEVDNDSPFEVNVKRLYLPIQVTTQCPECGREVTKYLDSEYVSFPKFCAPETLHFYCFDDDGNETGHEFELPVRFSIDMQILGEPKSC